MRAAGLCALLVVVYGSAALAEPPPGEGVLVSVFGDDGARVAVDDRQAGVLPLAQPLLLPPGPHTVRLERGKRRVETKVELLLNRPVEVRFTLVPPVALITPTAAAPLLLEWGGVGDRAREALLSAASRAAAEERVLLLPAQALSAAMPEVAGCLETVPCQERLAARAEAQYVLSLKVESAQQASGGRRRQAGGWRFELRIHDVATGSSGGEGTAECGACDVDTAAGRLGELVARIVRGAATRRRGTLEVASVPAGAEVVLDGRAVGATPVRRPALVGPHEVIVRLPGFVPYTGQATVTDGTAVSVEARLSALPPPPPPPVVTRPVPAQRVVRRAVLVAPPPVPIYRRWWLWGAVGLVTVGVVAGVVGGIYGPPVAPQIRQFPNPRDLEF